MSAAPPTVLFLPAAAPVAGGGPAAGWDLLTQSAGRQAPGLCGPAPGAHGVCRTCHGPVPVRLSRCYQCTEHAESLPGLTAGAVVPVCYAVKGGPHARNLWLYKSARPGAAAARADLLALLAVFLRDHGPCVWRSAGMTAPSHLAVVPSGRGRPGPHPLRALVEPLLALPWAQLGATAPGDPAGRAADPGRFSATGLRGADVALLDDTWTSGASAQSAAAALRLAGARSVAVIVLGRHLCPGQAGPAGAAAFQPGVCAVHSSPAVRSIG
jgi:hypothetical protein